MIGRLVLVGLIKATADLAVAMRQDAHGHARKFLALHRATQDRRIKAQGTIQVDNGNVKPDDLVSHDRPRGKGVGECGGLVYPNSKRKRTNKSCSLAHRLEFYLPKPCSSGSGRRGPYQRSSPSRLRNRLGPLKSTRSKIARASGSE